MEDKLNYDDSGLLPAVIQDVDTGQVLMVAWMNQEAFRLTQQTRFVHFFSRRRQRIWKKGETSGNHLLVKEFLLDCDGDTLLLRVDPTGPTCHTGRCSCFYRKME